MKQLAYAVSAIVVCSAALVASGGQTATSKPAARPIPKPVAAHDATKRGTTAIDAQNRLVAQYCATCHSEKGRAGELSLAGFDAAKVTTHADVAEKMIRKLRAGMMPPPGARRPDAATLSAFVDALETKLDAAAARSTRIRAGARSSA